ncbi:MAG: DinB family protein [Fimbriimonas sp.]
MTDFAATWSLVRNRFIDAISGLTAEQLNWRLHPGTLTLGEMALHVAGVEISFCSQLLGETPEGVDARLKAAATDGSVNDKPFPFAVEEITPEFVSEALARALAKTEPLITNPDPYRGNQIVSALGPTIDGTGAFARLAYHPGYHQGQVHIIKTAPGFPA